MIYSGHYKLTEIDLVNSIKDINKCLDNAVKHHLSADKVSSWEQNTLDFLTKDKAVTNFIVDTMPKFVSSLDKHVFSLVKSINNSSIFIFFEFILESNHRRNPA